MSVTVGHHNVAVGSASSSFVFKTLEGLYIGEYKDYDVIMIGRVKFTDLVREVESLRNEVDFLKESLSRVLAEESLRDVEEIIAEKNPE